MWRAERTLGSTQTWAQLHEAFRRIGGSCRVVVLDNLAEGVLKPNIYNPSLNPLYLPCRVADPDPKGSRGRCRTRQEDATEGTAL